MKRKITALLQLGVLFFFSNNCGSDSFLPTNTGNPDALTSFKVVGFDGGATAKISAKALSGGITLTEATVVLEEIEFKPFESCQNEALDDGDIDFEGPFVVDLLSNTSVPDTNSIQLPAGKYCRIELEFNELDETEIPSGLNNNNIVNRAIYIAGTRSDATPFSIALDQNDDFRLENEVEGFDIDGDIELNQFLIAFNLEAWFAGVDLDSAVVSSGEIMIDKDNNDDLLDAIVDNIKNSSALFKDDDVDGELDDDELTNELAEGGDL